MVDLPTLSWAIPEARSVFLLNEFRALYSLWEGCRVLFLLQELERHSSSPDGVLAIWYSVVPS